MKLSVPLLSIVLPAIAFAADEKASEESTNLSETSTESSADSSRSQEIRIAGEVKRDAERYLAGAEMSRLLRSRLAELRTENPELKSDELIDYALADAVTTLAEVETGATQD